MKIKTDALVVGCGPAGTTAARFLAQEGFQVTAVERRDRIGGDIRCAEGLDLPTIRDIVGEIPKNLVSFEIDRIIIDYKCDRVRLNSPGHGVILNRELFDQYLGYLAARAGAEIILGCTVNELKQKDGFWRAKGQKNGLPVEIEAKIVVGADGPESMVGKMAGIDTSISPRDIYSCCEVRADISGMEEDGALLLALDEDLFTGGYAWSFPKENHSANIGLGIRGDAGGKTALERLDDWLSGSFKSAGIVSETAGVVPVKKMDRLSANGVFLVGDAARLADPLSGGGIGPALTSARLASEIASKLLKKDKLEDSNIYDKAWWHGEGRQFEQRLFLRNVYIANDKKIMPPVFDWAKKNLDGKTIEKFSADEMLLGLIKSVPALFKMTSSLVPTLMKMVFNK
ncbi:NAD(P)/FAD-dependent oxidoreductase [candidate division WOR-3 bacterium]|nr:NAD(P)/FAD-dependent oxidoreductase [candidate division WOR-3 bacterium]